MNKSRCYAPFPWPFLFAGLAAVLLSACAPTIADRSPRLVQIGGMHESIGQGQHQGRITLASLANEPHFYGVGALAELRGEVTIVDSVPVVTIVGTNGEPFSGTDSAAAATMFVGQSIATWKSVSVGEDVSHADFDKTIAQMASAAGLDVSHPFVFVIDGEFLHARLHVINGACPIHARMKRIVIEREKQPFELDRMALSGRAVGIYAADSVGKLTHPATSTHVHLIYSGSDGVTQLTGHIERIGIAKGSEIRFPAVN